MLILLITSLPPRIAWAASESLQPHIGEASKSEPAATSENATTSDANELQGLGVSPVPDSNAHHVYKDDDNNYFYRFSASMGPRLGLAFDSEMASRKYPLALLGFFYMLPSVSSSHLEVGADLLSNATGALHGGYKYIFGPNDRLRPYAKASLLLALVPKKGLVNFSDYSNLGARLAVGLEDLFKEPASLRWDLETTITGETFYVGLVIGYSWAW